ncbi:MAG: hypothetical protein JOZ18_03590 [Chloroflexi bacterium]|nr:hypothetical protein [Chloroflexota bacterium]
MQNQSEVARLLESIRLSYEAAQRAMTQPAITAPHEFITKRMEHVQAVHSQLKTLVGEQEATKLVVEALDNL